MQKKSGGVIDDAVSGRQVKNSLTISTNVRGGKTLVSLFCGTCSVEAKCSQFDNIICNDNHKYLIAMLNAVKHGYDLPESVSEQEYKYIREHKDDDPALAGFVGFGCSFGGKWFGGYARDNRTSRNYAAVSKQSLLNDMDNLKNAKFVCNDYRNVAIPEDAIIYADPPYANTTGYGGDKFDTDAFWEYMRVLSKKHKVFISELNAPDDFICIWEKPLRRTLDVNKNNNFMSTEKLFTL